MYTSVMPASPPRESVRSAHRLAPISGPRGCRSARRGSASPPGELRRGSERWVRWLAALVVLAGLALPRAAFAGPRIAITAGSCPSRDAMIFAIAQVMPSASIAARADAAPDGGEPVSVVTVSDDGASYRVQVGAITRRFADPAARCEDRAGKAAIVVALALDPPNVAMPEGPPATVPAPDDPASVAPASPLRPSARPPHPAPRSLTAPYPAASAASAGGAPPDAASSSGAGPGPAADSSTLAIAGPASAGARAPARRVSWQLQLGVAFEHAWGDRVQWTDLGAPAIGLAIMRGSLGLAIGAAFLDWHTDGLRMRRTPIDLAVRVRTGAGPLRMSLDLGPRLVLERSETEIGGLRDGVLALHVRAAFGLELWPWRRYGVFASGGIDTRPIKSFEFLNNYDTVWPRSALSASTGLILTLD